MPNTNATAEFIKLRPLLESIHGWCLPEALATWDAFLSLQKSRSITGNFLEIGVWRGKTAALMLHHLNQNNEKMYLVDIKIVKNELKQNFNSVCRNHEDVVIYNERSSFGLEHADIPSHSCRYIHIDGKHTGEAVYNDLKAADKFLSHDGIVCIDDFFEQQYPQISQAVFRYLDRNPYSFAMFLCGFKKAYLARIEYVEHYLNYCTNGLSEQLEARNALVTVSKTTHMADFNCFSIVPRYSNHIYRGPDWNKKCIETNNYMEIPETESL